MKVFVQLSARSDILRQYLYYLGEADPGLAARFLDAVNESFDALVALPDAGAPRRSGNPNRL